MTNDELNHLRILFTDLTRQIELVKGQLIQCELAADEIKDTILKFADHAPAPDVPQPTLKTACVDGEGRIIPGCNCDGRWHASMPVPDQAYMRPIEWWEQHCRELRAENERLRERCEKAESDCAKRHATLLEIERLRAALEFIAQYSSDPTAQHTAQDALAPQKEGE